MKAWCMAVLLAAWVGTWPTPLAAEGSAAPREDIAHLVERFRQAILAKDGDALRGMFLPGAPWWQVTDPATLAAIRLKKPTAPAIAPGSYEQFASFVARANQPVEETFDHVRVDTDGIIGTVHFDYRFVMGGKVTNHGTETWQVMHTDEGWKINAMLYSVIVDDIR